MSVSPVKVTAFGLPLLVVLLSATGSWRSTVWFWLAAVVLGLAAGLVCFQVWRANRGNAALTLVVAVIGPQLTAITSAWFDVPWVATHHFSMTVWTFYGFFSLIIIVTSLVTIARTVIASFARSDDQRSS